MLREKADHWSSAAYIVMSKSTEHPTPHEAFTDAAESLLQLLWGLAAELHPGRRLPEPSLDRSLEQDLGIDSLGRAELLTRLEQHFQVHLPEQRFAKLDTPRQLLQLIASAAPPASAERLAPAVAEQPALTTGALPDAASTLPEVLQWHAQRHGKRIHIHLYGEDEQPQPISYQALLEGAQHMAAGLQAAGLQPGQSVAIMLPTGTDYLFSFFGILLTGGVPVPIYPPLRPSQLEDHLRRHAAILENAQAVMLVTVPEARALARLLRSQAPGLQQLLIAEELRRHERAAFAPPELSGEQTAFLQYTSGSTGTPKGVVLSHANLLANIRAMGEAVQVRPDDRFVSWLPLYHDMGLIGAWLGSLYFAIPLALMSPLTFLHRPQRWLQVIHHHRGTISAAPNFAYELCCKRIRDEHLQGLDLGCWRMACNGAEPVSAQTMRRFQARFAPYGFRPEAMAPVYGLAECSVGLAFPTPGSGMRVDRIERDTLGRLGKAVPAAADAPALEVVACGHALPGHEIRIVDANGQELPPRREGRLQFRGPSATSGYFRNPQKTAELLQGEWLDSGDLAYRVDDDIFLTSRTKDVIIRGGRNLYPYEMEESVGDIEGVRKGCVAVFGHLDPASGTEQLVVLAETREQDPEIRKNIEQRIVALGGELLGAPPDEIVLARPHTVLKTSSGKIRRGATRELFEQGRHAAKARPVWVQIARLAISGGVLSLRRLMARLADTLYAVYAWVLFFCFAIPAWLLTQLLPNIAARWRMLHHAARLFRRLAGVALEVQGAQHLAPPRHTILVANHASYIDAIVLAEILPRPFCFVAKAELLSNFVPRLFLQRIGAEFVERFDSKAGAQDAERVAQLAAGGKSLMFFAEGTFQDRPGLMPFRMGAFVAAAKAGAPVIPLSINGSRSILTGRNWHPRRGRIRVTIGAPIEPQGSDWSDALALRDQARQAILRDLDEPDLER